MSCERECFNGKCGGWRYISGAWIPEITACTNRRRKKKSPSPPKVLINLTRTSMFLLENLPFPSDLNAKIVEEVVGGSVVSGLFSLVRSKTDQFVVSLKKPLRSGQTARFQLNIHDPRYALARNAYEISQNKTYVTSISMSNSIGSFISNPMDKSSLDYQQGWLEEFRVAYDNMDSQDPLAFDPPVFDPPEKDQFWPEFNPFGHAINELYSAYSDEEIKSYESNNEFIEAHIGEFRNYSLDYTMMREYYLVGKETPASLDSLRALDLTGDQTNLVTGRNFLGVKPEIFRCIIQQKLYKIEPDFNKPSWPMNWINPGSPNNNPSFDCRSFTESAMIFLRSQLSSVCKDAKVSFAGVGNHALVHVDLGGGDLCCTGEFLYEPQSGDSYTRQEDLCKDSPNIKPCPDPFIFIEKSPDFDAATGWEDSQEAVSRIADTICGCVPEGNPPGSAEEQILYRCKNGSFGSWFKDNFAYGPNNDPLTTSPQDGYGKNGPGGANESNPSIAGMPQILGCKKYRCDSSDQCKETGPYDSQGLSEYECNQYCMERGDCNYDSGVSGPKSCQKIGFFTQDVGYVSEEKCKENCRDSSSSTSDSSSSTSGSSSSSACVHGTSTDFNDCDETGYDTLDVARCECICYEGRHYEGGICVDSSSSSTGCLDGSGVPCSVFPCQECDDQGQCVSTCKECQECVDGSCQDRPICTENQYLKKPECECACFSAEANGCMPPKVQTGENCDCVCMSPPQCADNQVLNDQCECWCANPPDCGEGTGFDPLNCECCPSGYYWDPGSTSCMSPSSSSAYNPLPTMINDFDIKW
jgi:hypothetical protein